MKRKIVIAMYVLYLAVGVLVSAHQNFGSDFDPSDSALAAIARGYAIVVWPLFAIVDAVEHSEDRMYPPSGDAKEGNDNG